MCLQTLSHHAYYCVHDANKQFAAGNASMVTQNGPCSDCKGQEHHVLPTAPAIHAPCYHLMYVCLLARMSCCTILHNHKDCDWVHIYLLSFTVTFCYVAVHQLAVHVRCDAVPVLRVARCVVQSRGVCQELYIDTCSTFGSSQSHINDICHVSLPPAGLPLCNTNIDKELLLQI